MNLMKFREKRLNRFVFFFLLSLFLPESSYLDDKLYHQLSLRLSLSVIRRVESFFPIRTERGVINVSFR